MGVFSGLGEIREAPKTTTFVRTRQPRPIAPPRPSILGNESSRSDKLLQRVFVFYGGAREFVRYQGVEAVVHGPAETGKTISALWKLHLCAMKYARASIVIVRKVQGYAYSTVLQTYMKKVLVEKSGVRIYGGEKPEWFDYPNGARIWVVGLDKPGKVLSAEHDLVFVNQVEELSEDDWEFLTSRTTGRAGNMPYSQTIGDMNPAWPAHWVYHRRTLRLFPSKHQDNPLLYDPGTGKLTAQGERTMSVLGALTGVRRQRLFEGIPAQAEGGVYDEWDPAVHMVYAADVPATPRLVAAMDWGYTNPGVLGVWGVDGDGRMYLLAQVYQTQRTIDWWVARAKELKAEFQSRSGRWEFVACDPSEPAYIDAFRRAGLPAVAANNAVLPGINAVKKRLADRRLFIVRDSLGSTDPSLSDRRLPQSVEDEFPMYVWADRAGKETPAKEHDHGVDMVRYAVMQVDARRVGGLLR